MAADDLVEMMHTFSQSVEIDQHVADVVSSIITDTNTDWRIMYRQMIQVFAED